MKKIVTEIGRKDIDFEDSIDNVISMLQRYKEEGWTNITCEYIYDTKIYHFCKQRHETDNEYNERILLEESIREYRRKHYEDLKKESIW
jgi:hypothetical protein